MIRNGGGSLNRYGRGSGVTTVRAKLRTCKTFLVFNIYLLKKLLENYDSQKSFLVHYYYKKFPIRRLEIQLFRIEGSFNYLK